MYQILQYNIHNIVFLGLVGKSKQLQQWKQTNQIIARWRQNSISQILLWTGLFNQNRHSGHKRTVKSMYQVESIVGKRINPDTNQIQYRVKWFNYPSEDNTWQPERNLKFVKELITQFNEKNELRGQTVPQSDKSKLKQQLKNNTNSSLSANSNKNSRRDNSDQQLMNGDIFQQQEQNELNKQNDPELDESDKQKQIAKNTKQKSQKSNSQEQRKDGSFATNKDRDKQRSQIKTPRQKVQNNQNKQKSSKLLLRQVQLERNKPIKPSSHENNSSDKVPLQNKRVPPPLPPDFSINKSKYIDPASSLQKSAHHFPPKHKPIQKQRISEPNLSKRQNNLEPDRFRHHQFKNRQQSQSSKYKSTSNLSKTIPPPLPGSSYAPPTHSMAQSSYYPNQYPNYHPRMQQQYPSRMMHQNNYHKPAASGYQNPMYGQTQQSYDYQNYQYGNQGYESKNYPGDRNIEVYQVLNMQKTESGYLFFADTNKGQVWLTRNQIVPRFSTQLVQFYERHLTFQE